MLHDTRIDNWYGVFALTGDEDKVKERIQYRLSEDFTVMVPKRKLKIRKGGILKVETKVLFPGYVLLNGEVNTDIYYRLKNIPNVLRFLKTGNTLTPINSNEMTVLSKLICN